MADQARKYTSSFDCQDAGEHDDRPGARCPNCGFINPVKGRRPPRRPPLKREGDGLDDLRDLLRFD